MYMVSMRIMPIMRKVQLLIRGAPLFPDPRCANYITVPGDCQYGILTAFTRRGEM